MMDKSLAEKNLIENMDYIKAIINNVVKMTGSTKRLFDLEDFYQEAYMAYLDACQKYDETRGASLMTFAAKMITNRVYGILRSKKVSGIYHDVDLETAEANPKNIMDFGLSGVEDGFEEAESAVWAEEVDRYLAWLENSVSCQTLRYGVMLIRNEVRHEMGDPDALSGKEFAASLGLSTRYLSVCKKRVREKYLYHSARFQELLQISA